jgi:hypothetical protein
MSGLFLWAGYRFKLGLDGLQEGKEKPARDISSTTTQSGKL